MVMLRHTNTAGSGEETLLISGIVLGALVDVSLAGFWRRSAGLGENPVVDRTGLHGRVELHGPMVPASGHARVAPSDNFRTAGRSGLIFQKRLSPPYEPAILSTHTPPATLFTELDRDVALKVSKAEFTARFKREARAMAAFNHPNICRIYDVGPNYIVMEWIDGIPLAGPLSVEKAVPYAGQILDALDAAHRKTFTHRDLKPANVMVTAKGVVKLLDFGLAKQRARELGPDDLTGPALSKEGNITGTLQYMSPEQLNGSEADARSDIFAFGCVLCEMLSGKKAFSGSTTASVIAAIMEREPEPLKTTPPLDRVIRTQSKHVLSRCLNGAASPAEPPSG
jgi:serine/threonine protein kinase